MEKAAQGGVTLIALTSLGFVWYGLYKLYKKCYPTIPAAIPPAENLTATEEV